MSIRCTFFGHDIQFPTNVWEPMTCGRCGAMLSQTIETWVNQAERREPSMSVKVEKIAPIPRFNIFYTAGGPNYVEVSESEARAIYDGLAPHFGGSHNGEPCYYSTLDVKRRMELREKDAEIARLKAPAVTYSGSALALLDAKDAEIVRLRGWMADFKRGLAEVNVLRDRIDRALAGEAVPKE